jgi:glycerophosphoryl diester phosphodiesterase
MSLSYKHNDFRTLMVVCLIMAVLLLVSCGTAAPVPTATGEPAAAPTTPPTVEPLPTAQTWPSILVVAHRGGAALAPENTLGAFANALKIGVDMVECDVHLSKDGEMVIMHDPDLTRTTDGNGFIYRMDYADIRKLNAAAKFKVSPWTAELVPTLGEVLDLVKGKAKIQIEIKVETILGRYKGIEQKVIDAVNARGMVDDVIIISFDFPTIADVKKLDPRFKTGALMSTATLSLNAKKPYDQYVDEVIQQTGADYIMPSSAGVSDLLINAVHARGLGFGVWTVNSESEMRRMAEWGVDAITTNDPVLLKQVLGK